MQTQQHFTNKSLDSCEFFLKKNDTYGIHMLENINQKGKHQS